MVWGYFVDPPEHINAKARVLILTMSIILCQHCMHLLLGASCRIIRHVTKLKLVS